jgi:hypothetical protein
MHAGIGEWIDGCERALVPTVAHHEAEAPGPDAVCEGIGSQDGLREANPPG